MVGPSIERSFARFSFLSLVQFYVSEDAIRFQRLVGAALKPMSLGR
jgi:hypothetical protein